MAREFISRIRAKTEVSASGCWVWTGARDSSGYARISYRSRNWKASRAIWTVSRGEIPSTLCILHRCDNRLCVNLAHLFLGTNADNSQDMSAKGRGPMGRAKIDAGAVLWIRAETELTAKEMAVKYGLSLSGIYAIINKKTWRHV